MFDFEIRKVKPEAVKPIYSDELEKERFREIKSRLGKAAFIETFGEKKHVTRIKEGIKRSESALKWVADTFKDQEES